MIIFSQRSSQSTTEELKDYDFGLKKEQKNLEKLENQVVKLPKTVENSEKLAELLKKTKQEEKKRNRAIESSKKKIERNKRAQALLLLGLATVRIIETNVKEDENENIKEINSLIEVYVGYLSDNQENADKVRAFLKKEFGV